MRRENPPLRHPRTARAPTVKFLVTYPSLTLRPQPAPAPPDQPSLLYPGSPQPGLWPRSPPRRAPESTPVVPPSLRRRVIVATKTWPRRPPHWTVQNPRPDAHWGGFFPNHAPSAPCDLYVVRWLCSP